MNASSAWTVRALQPDDRDAWEVVWQQYLEFYRQVVPAEISDHVFARLVDPDDAVMLGWVAVDGDDTPVGLANVIVHPSTWTDRDVAYLEDLAAREDLRGRGVGRALIEAIVQRGEQDGWRDVFWITDQDNVRARRLYDGVATLTNYVRYERPLA